MYSIFCGICIILFFVSTGDWHLLLCAAIFAISDALENVARSIRLNK